MVEIRIQNHGHHRQKYSGTETGKNPEPMFASQKNMIHKFKWDAERPPLFFMGGGLVGWAFL